MGLSQDLVLFQQVPATVALPGTSNSAAASEDRLDGTVLVLTEDPSGRIVFALSMASTPARTAAYTAQMDHFLLQLHQEVQRMGVGKLSDLDPVLSSILSLVYYFYNLTPLTRGSSVVAYAVALGLIMSLGRQVCLTYIFFQIFLENLSLVTELFFRYVCAHLCVYLFMNMSMCVCMRVFAI